MFHPMTYPSYAEYPMVRFALQATRSKLSLPLGVSERGVLMRARLNDTRYRSKLTILVFFFCVAEDPVRPFSLIPLPSINLKTDRRWTWLGVGWALGE